MKKTILFVLSILVGIALFIGVIQYIGIDDFKAAFKSFSWWIIGVVTLLGFTQMFIIIYRWKLILKAQGDDVPFKKIIAPKFVGHTVSYLTPGPVVGGEPVAAYLLKRNTGIGYSKGFASILVDKILDFTYPLPFLVAAIVYAIFKYDIPWKTMSAFVIVLLGLIALLVVFYVQTYRGKGFFTSVIRALRLHRFSKIEKYLEKILHFEALIIKFFNHQKKLFIKGLLLSLLGGIVIVLQFVVVLFSLHIDADVVQILMMMVFMILSSFMPLPASLGSFEAGQVIVFSALGHPASIGVAFVLILRSAEVFKVGLGLIFLSNIGITFLKNLPKNGNGKNFENAS